MLCIINKLINVLYSVLQDIHIECSKDAILLCATLTYDDDDEKPCTIQVDASNVGVGATLIQEDKVIEYHSRALTSAQQHYSNIEREAYALVNDVEHFHHYINGNHSKYIQTISHWCS